MSTRSAQWLTHAGGDRVIIGGVARLTAHLPDDTCVGRISGDEVAVALSRAKRSGRGATVMYDPQLDVVG